MSDKKQAVPKTKVMKTYSLYLNTKERIVFGSLFPQRGSFLTMGMANSLRERVKFSEEEQRILKIREVTDEAGNPTGAVAWSDVEAEKYGDTKVEISEGELDFLRQRVNTIDQEGNITLENYRLCQKIRGAVEYGDESA